MAAVQQVSGLNALAGLQGFTNPTPEATPEEIHGGPVNPAHGLQGEVAQPYSWENEAMGIFPHGPYGPDAGIITFTGVPALPAGVLNQDPTSDKTPYRTHAAPWPKGNETSVGPDAIARQLEQSAQIHGVKTDAGKAFLYDPTMVAVQDQWTQIWDVDAGQSNLSTDVPAQLKGATAGWGTRSREQSFARQNEYGFDSHHFHRRFATGTIPGNYMWMRPGGRAMVKSLPGPARPPIGTYSPFAGQDLSKAFNTEGAILNDPATEYQAPPTPYVAPPSQPDLSQPDIAWW